jgi:hypothetical protein
MFNTSLLREKFIIIDVMPGDLSDKEPVIALSNRLMVPLISGDGQITETFVVRAQNMHICMRMAAKIAQDFQEHGPIMDRNIRKFDWEASYLALCKGYEKKWNPNRWMAVYHKGRVIFEGGEEGKRHPFLDIIEQCDARNKGDYERSLEVAEDAFKQAGKMVTIEHDANVASIINHKKGEAKCGIILRGPNRTTTFNFTARNKAGREVRVSQCLSVSAAFLEGIQLAFLVGMTNMKVHFELIEGSSDEASKGRDASSKLSRLNGAITQFENLFDVVYRPDRPDLARMIDEAEDFAQKVFSAEISKKIALGEEQDWVD